MYTEEQVLNAIRLAREITLEGETMDINDLAGLTEVCTYSLEEKHPIEYILNNC